MKKFKRYFENEDDTPQSSGEKKEEDKTSTLKENKKVLTYHVNVGKKMKIFGRRKEEFQNNKRRNKVEIPKEALERHSRGETLNISGIKTGIYKKRFEVKEKRIKFSHKLAAQTEVLLTEDAGFLETDEGETSTQFTQKQIINNVDISAASKAFDLKLTDFGPYRAKYTRNGRHLLLGGKLGHVAAFDWVTKKLHCELNVMETVHDISWLHLETMFALAQKNWVYIYDNQGVELHCIKKLNKISKMEFLPYHFLLGTISDEGYISWLDISIGQLVSQFNTKFGKLSLLAQNPYNAVLCLGHSKGIVSMWSPTSKEPLAKMLCHGCPLSAIHVDPYGTYMATAAVNREVRIWDVRKLDGPLQSYRLPGTINNLNFSQKSMLAVGMENIVDIYRDCCISTAKRPYLRHRFNNQIGNMQFCPFEDVLGVATSKGFTSLLIPGSGEANYDALEANPYQTKTQRKEFEVKALLEKIQPELITLDPTVIADVDVPTMKDKIDAKQKLLHLKPPKIKYEHRNKMKGRGGVAKIARNKKIVQALAKKEFIKSMKEIEQPKEESEKKKPKRKPTVFDRFLPKK